MNYKEEEIKKIHKEHLEMEKQEAEKAAEDESTILQQAQGERLGTNKKKKIKEKELEKLNNFAQFEQLSLNKHIPPKTAVPEPVKGWQTKNKIEKKAKKIKPVTTKLESKRAQNNTFLVTLDKQKRSQALQKLINKEDENPLLKVAQINPVRYLQS